MIIVNLKGGLGNQMFQYAFGRKLSLKNKDLLKLDTAGLARANEIGDIYRPFSLDAFAIEKNIATAEEVRRVKYPYGIVSKLLRWIRFRLLKQNNVFWDPKKVHRTGDLFLDGYWQSPKYFEDVRETLLSDFKLEEPLRGYVKEIADTITQSTSVSIHVRRGDYAQNPRVLKEFGLCTSNYYQNAITLIRERYPEAVYFVFSDDIAWTKENLPLPQETVFVSDPSLSDVQELTLMSLCKHIIIANSTFSWWAAWLNQNPGKTVIAPTPWFDNKPADPYLIPDSWIQIPKQ